MKIQSNINNYNHIIRPKKFFQTKGSLKNKFHVLWVDTKRNYSAKDFENAGKIKNSKILKKFAIVRKLFDYFELKLKNFHKVSDRFYRGAAPSCKYDIGRLKRKGVTDIINLLEPQKRRIDIENYAKECKINYHFITLSKNKTDSGVPTIINIKAFFDIIKNAKGALYVHCLHGKDRTGIMTCLYETEILKRPFEVAYKHMIKYGLHESKNTKMIEYLKQKYSK